MIDRKTFVRGPIPVPWPVRGDAYTVSSHKIVSPQAKARSVYNFTNRRSPAQGLPQGVAKDSRMVLYGLVDFIQRELTVPVTSTDVEYSRVFMNSARVDRQPLDFDEVMWRRVVDEYNGYLPIRIEALPECSTFWPQEPVIQVTSLGDGFGEIAALVEATMVGYVANATARLTLTRHLLERVRAVVRKHNPTYSGTQIDATASIMVHDFGMRASSTPQESEIYGRAHLLCFNGTDTFNAAFQAWATNAKRPIGTSILALAHRIVQGYTNEERAYEALLAATKDSLGSYVADCYDFHNAVRRFLVNIARRGEATVVCRPDSGDFIENILFVVEQAMAAGLYQVDEQGKYAATTLRFIEGDSMNWEKMQLAFAALEVVDANPTQWGIFGIGGWLRNSTNRDTLSSAYKLAACGQPLRPVCKLSETAAKLSVPGPTVVCRPEAGPTVYFANETHPESKFVTFYDGSMRGPEAFRDPCLEDFNKLRERCLVEFEARDYAGGSPLSPAIRRFQQNLRAELVVSVP